MNPPWGCLRQDRGHWGPNQPLVHPEFWKGGESCVGASTRCFHSVAVDASVRKAEGSDATPADRVGAPSDVANGVVSPLDPSTAISVDGGKPS